MNTTIYLISNAEVINKNMFNDIVNTQDNQEKIEKVLISQNGEKEAEKLSQSKEFKNLDAIYSSNYVRSLETAKYFAKDLIINVDARLNERKIGDNSESEYDEYIQKQNNDFDFNLPGGESLNDTKKRMIAAVKNILMYESGNRVAIFSHPIAITLLLSAWCEIGQNYAKDLILSYNNKTIVDGDFAYLSVFKIVFDGMIVKSVEKIEN